LILFNDPGSKAMKSQHCTPTFVPPAAPPDAIVATRRLDRERGPGELLTSALAQLAVWHERARQRRQLRLLDDHLRRDLGLTQAAVDAEVAKPFWRP
jgi:uncharacterized protein YjiS (DUF1127 family)